LRKAWKLPTSRRLGARPIGYFMAVGQSPFLLDSSAWMEPYHDRMPVLLEEEDFHAWLDGPLGPEALKPASESALREWTVSSRLNRTGVGDDDPTIIEPIVMKSTPV
jgi:hypothetical protein